MNIIFIAKGDWAGVGNSISSAINKSGLASSRMISYTQPGSYTKYGHDLLDLPKKDLVNWWNWSDVVVLFDDAETMIPITCLDKPIIEAYNGTWYRADPERRNVLASNRNRLQVAITPDLSKHGPSFIGRPIDIIDSSDAQKLPEFTALHCPTSRALKGTDRIIDEIGPLSQIGIALKVCEKYSNEEILEFKKQAHIVIDQVKPGVGGSGFGVNSLEAWALGIPSVCDPSEENLSEIKKLVGYFPFVYPKDGDTLASVVTRLKDDADFYAEAVSVGRRYINEFHKPDIVAEKWVTMARDAMNSFAQHERSRKISVCMIARNEADIVGKAIASTRMLADEVVVVDTGSTDGTVSLCKSLGCIVIEGYDNMHKSNARNASIEAATGDWIVILDCDEEIVDPVSLRRQIESATADFSSICITAGSAMGRGCVPLFKFYQNRCWPKNNYRYRWRAHELPYALPGVSVKEAHSNVLFAHYPRKTKEHESWKLQYTLDRLLLDVSEYPDAPRPLFYLGRQYMYMKQHNKALEALNKYLDITAVDGAWDRADARHHLYTCYKELACSVNEKERRLLETKSIESLYLACLERPSNRKWWFELAMFYYGRKRYNIALGLLKCMMEIPEDSQDGFIYSETCGANPHDIAARCLWYMGRYDEGLEFSKKAVALDPSNGRLKDNLSFFIRKIEKILRREE